MATRKDPQKNNNSQERKHRGLGCLFWIAFILLIISLFLINKPIIEKNLGTFLEPFKKNINTDSPLSPPDVSGEEGAAPAKPAEPLSPVAESPTTTGNDVVEPRPLAPAAEKPAPPSAEPAAPRPEEPSTTPTPKPAPVKEKEPSVSKPEQPSVQTRERTLWLVRLDADGTLVRSKTTRKLPASESPLTDTLNTLLEGPLPAESAKGLGTLIPSDTVLLSVIVRGSTAYINLSESFQFNTYGIEGYAAQLKQIVWTATEFPSVKDVQILIEGRRVDYLGSEGIFIGSPLSRESL